MSLRVLMLSYRKPGTTPEQFKAYYDEVHVPLMQYLTGPLFPLSHTRRYVQRTRSTGDATTGDSVSQHPASILSGAQADFVFDAITEMVFEGQDAF
ncbi:hypothetical protein AJ79_02939 [Helicocarpus griseus UAMH5409]|uniref:EthD domain-containing protein n=1 Tax=Helicocarpus griseus UAMH5409 TaxID=1447875 RepID=A0A2B7XS59_9EURO|nr:hypothetical protein AJ79_02939 [Helicocarpus griseus UAMH5409]